MTMPGIAGSASTLCYSASVFTTAGRGTALSILNPFKTHHSSAWDASSLNSLFSSCCRNNSFLSSHQFQRAQLDSLAAPNQRRIGFYVSAGKRQPKGGPGLLELDDSNKEDDDYDEDDEDDELMLPFSKMEEWLKHKPRGFGEGKVYDTSIEDKLLEEIEQSRKAQAANSSNSKNSPAKLTSKNDDRKQKASEVDPSGIRVRILNLSKKKNIHKDLKCAFKGVSGITNIIPAVCGNKKTRDPVCKGFAFIDFKSEGHAARFVQAFSGQILLFGKVKKQIKCEMINSYSSNSVQEKSKEATNPIRQLDVSSLEEDCYSNFESNESVMDMSSQNSDSSDREDEFEDIRESLVSVSLSKVNDNDCIQVEKEPAKDTLSRRSGKKYSANGQKRTVKVNKVPKLDVPGSAKRLRIKEKAVLTCVLSKYAGKADFASQKGR